MTGQRRDDIHRDESLEEAFGTPVDPFAIDPMPLMHDAMLAQSIRALELARAAGLALPEKGNPQ